MLFIIADLWFTVLVLWNQAIDYCGVSQDKGLLLKQEKNSLKFVNSDGGTVKRGGDAIHKTIFFKLERPSLGEMNWET